MCARWSRRTSTSSRNASSTYSNFISRIIYDMKWYDQDINTIVNPIFRTNINAMIEFIVHHVFLRISSKNEMFEFQLALDPALPLCPCQRVHRLGDPGAADPEQHRPRRKEPADDHESGRVSTRSASHIHGHDRGRRRWHQGRAGAARPERGATDLPRAGERRRRSRARTRGTGATSRTRWRWANAAGVWMLENLRGRRMYVYHHDQPPGDMA